MRIIPLIVMLAVLGGCSTLPQSGPDMGDAAEEAAARNIDYTELDSGNVGDFRAKPHVDNPLAASIPIGNVRLELGPGDALRIQMFETSATGSLFGEGGGILNRVSIDDKGYITLPYAGRMRAAGLTPAQLQQRISAQLSQLAVEPAAFVEVVHDVSNSIVVTGAVPQAGRQSLRQGIASAIDALNAAGGIAAEPWHYDLVLRRNGEVTRRTVADLQNGGDFAVQPGDRLLVERRPKRFIALGALQAAGAFDFPEPQISLLGALATARGLSDQRANRRGVYVFRPSQEAGVRPHLFLLDMAESHSLFIADAFAVQPGDAVYVTNAPITDVNKVLDPILRSLAIFNFSTSVTQ